MFKIANTYSNPQTPVNAQRGQPAPGQGAQQTGPARLQPAPMVAHNRSGYVGVLSWLNPATPKSQQRGFPVPENALQKRPHEVTQKNPDGNVYYHVSRPYSRGAARSVPITPTVFTVANPGTYVPCKPNITPRYPMGQYIAGTVFWANQTIPKSIELQGLQTQKGIAAILSQFKVYGKARA